MRIFGTLVIRALTLVWLAGLMTGLGATPTAWATELTRTMHVGKFLKIETLEIGRVQKTAFPGSPASEIKLQPRLDTPLARRWAMTKSRVREEAGWLNSCTLGACRDPRAAAWQRTVDLVRATAPMSRPALVQQIVSRNIRYVGDRSGDDHWASPLTTLLRRAGDCEDHVLLKQAILTAAGFASTQTWLLILETSTGGGHMVLQVLGSRPVILDNRYRYPITPDRLQDNRVAGLVTDRTFYVVK